MANNTTVFHAVYQEYKATIDINTLELIEGDLPKRARILTIEWAIEHRDELLDNWHKTRNREPLNKTRPLD
jgi:hypothetical protein